ncbi:MAG: SRPBCC domain-containing protein [Candidatus Hydrogenedentes bacterium]|nr:SRPBCC domain-containing protein [Candidatus Hydrogenedentota bacterium]
MAGRNKSAVAEAVRGELVITRDFDAPRELVFNAWTDPKHIVQWFGPRDYPSTQMDMDVRVGGVWRGCLKSTEGKPDLWLGGVFREIAKPERLVFTFAWEEPGERGLETVVAITFSEHEGKTRMTFRQTPFQSVTERDGHHYGWSSTFDRLAEYVAQN